MSSGRTPAGEGELLLAVVELHDLPPLDPQQPARLQTDDLHGHLGLEAVLAHGVAALARVGVVGGARRRPPRRGASAGRAPADAQVHVAPRQVLRDVADWLAEARAYSSISTVRTSPTANSRRSAVHERRGRRAGPAPAAGGRRRGRRERRRPGRAAARPPGLPCECDVHRSRLSCFHANQRPIHHHARRSGAGNRRGPVPALRARPSSWRGPRGGARSRPASRPPAPPRPTRTRSGGAMAGSRSGSPARDHAPRHPPLQRPRRADDVLVASAAPRGRSRAARRDPARARAPAPRAGAPPARAPARRRPGGGAPRPGAACEGEVRDDSAIGGRRRTSRLALAFII